MAERKKRKAYVNQKECVACGCCMKVCPKGAIQVFRGIMAQVDHEKGSFSDCWEVRDYRDEYFSVIADSSFTIFSAVFSVSAISLLTMSSDKPA